LRIFSELAGQLPHLDVANLHEYRKRLKEALYLAESSAPVDPTAKRLAVAFRKIHSSAGAWHDWHSLATQVTRLFPRNDPQTGLVPVLDSLAAAALDQAVGLCQQSAVRLLHRSDETRPASKRKPVAPSSVEVLTLMLLG
jgi:CHAD domain-containing protein